MERERHFGQDRFRDSGDGPPGGHGLDQQRSEIEELLRVSDDTFDSISALQAQDYLQQNLQTGGQ